MTITGKTCVITGASRGIGLEVSKVPGALAGQVSFREQRVGGQRPGAKAGHANSQ
jgi:NAD(P)-dependent dehydrogenase (short-subunit alcohol dehydrogenase family)